MKKKLYMIGLCLLLAGCGKESLSNTQSEVIETEMTELSATEIIETEETEVEAGMNLMTLSQEEDLSKLPQLLQDFFDGSICITQEDGSAGQFAKDLQHDEEDADSFSFGEQLDFDNDGELEIFIEHPFIGGMILDARNDKVVILNEGIGTGGRLCYTYYDNAYWTYYGHFSADEEFYIFSKYNGNGDIVDSFELSATQENGVSEYLYRDQKISKEEYEAKKNEILHE